MEKELIIELNEIRKELEIPMDDFIKIIALAVMHRNNSKAKISDEMLYEIIISALTSYDYEISPSDKEKTSYEAIKLLIANERKERHIPDAILFDLIEEYLDDKNKQEQKNPYELVNKAAKALGL